MGKCPAPCDGSISIEQYQRMIQWSADTLADPREMIRQQIQRMQEASAELRFETAAKIKSFIEQLSQLGKGPFRHARPLRDFAYVAIQPGPAARSAKLFLILPGLIEEIADLLNEPARPSEILHCIFTAAEDNADFPLDAKGIEQHWNRRAPLIFPQAIPRRLHPSCCARRSARQAADQSLQNRRGRRAGRIRIRRRH